MSATIRGTTADAIATKVRILRKDGHPGSFLLVEGEDDAKLYRKFIDQACCQIRIAYNKNNVIGALAILEREGFRGLLAIADADFDALEGRLPHSPNLVFTDTHDLETMLIASPAFEGLLIERGDTNKIDQLGGSQGVRAMLLEVGKAFGYLRLYNDREKKSLCFDDLNFDQIVNYKALTVDRQALLRSVRHKSIVVVTDEELWRRAEVIADAGHDLWHVCCGHDLVQILSVALRRVIGSNNDAADVKPSGLEERLRLAYSFAHFQVTWLWRAIVAWESKNQPYIILVRGALPA